MSLERNKADIRIYACGGGGISIASKIYDWKNKALDGFANVKFAFVDTSKSNFKIPVDDEDVYLIEELDGQGKKRGLDAKESIIPVIADIVQNHKPSSLNIVLHTLAGGSGSVLSPLIVKELLNRDAPVIVVAIGDNGSVIESNNTLKTLQTYENLAINVVKKPIVMAYYYNEGSASRKEVDKYVINMIESLRCLFANQHIGLDSQDLYHWLRYDKVTDYPNQLAVLTMVGSNDDLHKVYGKAISVATLAAEGESTDYPETVEYHTEGEISKELSSKIYSVTTHFVISDGLVDRVAKDIESHLAKLKEEKDSRVIRQSIIKGVNDADESGLIV
nr:MAG TPA: tubulin [Caudoviricetes sp.]